MKEGGKKLLDKMDISKPKAVQPQQFIQGEREAPAHIPARQVEGHEREYRLGRQIERHILRLERIEAMVPDWYKNVYYTKQLWIGWMGIIRKFLGAFDNGKDFKLKEEMERRLLQAEYCGRKVDQILAFKELVAWAGGKKGMNWPEKPGHDDVREEWDELFAEEEARNGEPE
jgi:hypothetical protein